MLLWRWRWRWLWLSLWLWLWLWLCLSYDVPVTVLVTVAVTVAVAVAVAVLTVTGAVTVPVPVPMPANQIIEPCFDTDIQTRMSFETIVALLRAASDGRNACITRHQNVETLRGEDFGYTVLSSSRHSSSARLIEAPGGLKPLSGRSNRARSPGGLRPLSAPPSTRGSQYR